MCERAAGRAERSQDAPGLAQLSLADGEANGIKLHKYVSVWVWIICSSDEMKT